MTPPSVMFVTFNRPLTPIAQGIFRRCGLLVVERHTLEDVERMIDHQWRPDCLVVDLHALDGEDRKSALAKLCTVVERHVVRFDPPMHVLVSAAQFHGAEAQRCAALGVHVLATYDSLYRRVARSVMDLLGGGGSACCASTSTRRAART